MQSGYQPSDERPPVLLVPGGVNPGAISYAPLVAAIQDEAQIVVKDLEVYATETPPPDYGLEMEVEGIKRAAEAAGLPRFHLVGYSAGGASSLAFIARYPEMVRSLALIEPAWIGNPLTPEEQAQMAESERAMRLPPEESMRAFILADLRPGVEPPPTPPGPPPPWMAKRPAGLAAMMRAFSVYPLNREEFRRLPQPVYVAVGDLSHPIELRKAEILASLFPNIQIEVYEGRHHFDPPHRAEAERFARALRALWARSEQPTAKAAQ